MVTPLDLPSELWSAERVRAAAAPDGSLFVADGAQVLHYIASGALDPAFGTAGAATIPLPEGARFALAGIGAAPGGGALLVGTASYPERPIPLPGAPTIPGLPLTRGEAILVRLDSRGRPDPGFGSDGILLNTLGLPAPSDDSGRRFEAPSLSVADVAFDRRGRVVLVGSFVAGVTYCRDFNNAPIPNAFLARLGPGGELDPGFGAGGVVIDPRLEEAAQVELGPDGAPLVRGRLFGGCERRGAVLSAYTPAGASRAGFGSRGMRPEPGSTTALALDGGGRVVVGRSAGVTRTRSGDRGVRAWVTRLGADGRRDRGFGAGAPAGLVLPGKRSNMTAVVPTVGGRILVGAAIVTGDGKHRGRGYLAAFGLAGNGKRLLARGAAPLRTGFGRKASTYMPSALADPAGRLVLLSPLAAPYLPGGHGIALARYRFGP